jgi:hypothetical protein
VSEGGRDQKPNYCLGLAMSRAGLSSMRGSPTSYRNEAFGETLAQEIDSIGMESQ